MGSEPYIGDVQIFASRKIPQGWHLCDGTLLSISGNEALFSVIGNRFGGDARVNFAVPDLRGYIPMGTGTGAGLTPRALGNKVGTEIVALTLANLPSHTHDSSLELTPSVRATAAQGGQAVPGSGAVLASGYDIERAVPINNYTSSSTQGVPLGGTSDGVHGTLASTGAGQPEDNRMPFLCMNYIIAVVGLYPVRP